MMILFWVIGIHAVEVVALMLYLLLQRNKKLETQLAAQQERIEMFSYLVSQSSSKLAEIDSKGIFQADDEIGWFFNNIKDLQSILDDSLK